VILRLSAPWLMVGASLLFATMSVCVKLASAWYSSAELVMYRSLVGMVCIAALCRVQGQTLRTAVPGMHAWRAAVGVTSLAGWFYAITGLPLATAITLNYTSSLWMALFLIGGAVLVGGARIDQRLLWAVAAGFAGVALILRPTISQDQLWFGLIGLGSGVISALAYLQVASLGRVGEPESRIVFYFSLGGVVAGLGLSLGGSGLHTHTTWQGPLLLLAIGLLATIAQLMMTRAYAIGRPLVNASLQYLGIVFSFLYGVALFDDPVTASAVLGMLLVISAGIGAARLRQEKAAGTATLPDIEP
jgi:S-adenosylmethionine uptake transporter